MQERDESGNNGCTVFYSLDGNDLVASDLSSVHPKLLLDMHLISRFSFHWGSCNQIAFYHQFSFLILFNL